MLKNNSQTNEVGYATMQRQNKTISLADYIKRNPPGIVDKPTKPNSRAKQDCSICNGFGWKQSPRYNNHWFVCSCVSRDWSKKFEPKIDYSRFGIEDDELTLDWGLINPKISDGLKGLQAVKPAYERGHGMVFLYGTYGQAKTLLGKILIATALRDGKAAAYTNMNSALDDIRLAYDDEHMNTALVQKMQWWIDREILFIDELDKASKTDWALERIFQLLDQRYAKAIREEALTVIASNKNDDQLDGYLQSRLNDNRLGPIVHLNGTDGRLVMPKGWKH